MEQNSKLPITIALCAAVVALFLASATSRADDLPVPAAAFRAERPVKIIFEGPITALSEQFFRRKLKAAEEYRADLIVVEIESPGGEVEASFNIAEMLRKIDWARTVAYIPKNAYSGAAIISMGCDEIVMAPEAHLGDVGVIFTSKDRTLVDYVPEKVLSPYVRRFRTLAEAKGRSPALAEAMMDRSAAVHEYENTKSSERRFMTAPYAEASGADWKKLALVPETGHNVFLTVNGRRALELKLAQDVQPSEADVWKHYNAATEPLVLQWTGVDTTVLILTSPIVSALLIIVGLVCLYIEFSAPGIGIGGLLAGLCFVVFFWSHFLGGTAAWLEVLLFISGLAFVGVEFFLFPGFGVAGLTGLLLMVASVVLASQSFVVPHTESEIATFSTNLMVVAASMVGFIGAAVVVRRYFGVMPVFSALHLAPPVSGAASEARWIAPVSLGAMGEAHTALRPGGKANFDGQIVDVVADNTYINRGAKVEVTEIAGTKVVVREA